MNHKYLSLALSVLIVVVFGFSWLIAYGPLFEPMAYPGDLEPKLIPTIDGYYPVLDCLHTRIFFNGRTYPMTEDQIARECKGN